MRNRLIAVETAVVRRSVSHRALKTDLQAKLACLHCPVSDLTQIHFPVNFAFRQPEGAWMSACCVLWS